MKLLRRKFLRLSAGAAALPIITRLSMAQTYPSRSVRIIVGFAPGGGNDIAARLIGQWLSQRLGQSFAIENRPGAGGNIATEAVVTAPPDGHTLLLVNNANATNASLYDKLGFNFVRDIAPVGGIAQCAQHDVGQSSIPSEHRSGIHRLHQKSALTKSTWVRAAPGDRSIWPVRCSV